MVPSSNRAARSFDTEDASVISACLLASCLVVARSALFLYWEQVSFDADQAAVGLMAKHLAEGRAFPLFYPGQNYMLAVEAWLAAPLFWLVGPSVALLKLPLAVCNVAIAALLVRLLVRDAGLRPWTAFSVSSFFVMAPPVTSSRLLNAMGGSVEPLLYVLVMWIWRRRPVALGLVLGLGFLHREFTAYGAVALLVLDAWQCRSAWRDLVARWTLTACAAAAAMTVVQALRAWADVKGPGTSPLGFGASETNLDAVLPGFCLQTASLIGNWRWTLSENVPTLLGARRQPVDYFMAGEGTLGHDALLPLLSLAGALILVRLIRLRLFSASGIWADAEQGRPGGLAAYLVLVGGLTLAVYAARCDIQGPVLIRYTLLALFLPIGLLATYLRREPRSALRAAALLLVAGWALASVVDHGRLLDQYLRRPPEDAFRELSDYLTTHNVRYGNTTYWLAYPIAFLSNERVRLAAQEPVRVLEYQNLAARFAREAISLDSQPCPGGARVADLYVCPP